ncbi:MAG: LysM peptidoglycan-binding domain-containing protein [Acidobacteria bacterium]|nr:MAG: LysM peptidoglycan-binding domain-containing protein [Acidobacteriota bacterium]
MTFRTLLPVAAAVGVSLSIVGCGRTPKAVQVTVTPPPPPVVVQAPEPPPVDPVADLIAESQKHFTAGEKELALGHLEQARASFDLSIDVLLKSAYGARSEARIRQHFDQLVERISAHELTALSQGDGFVEKKTEPASIDELLAISTFDPPAATTATESAVASDLSRTTHDIEIPLNAKVLSYIELFQGRLRDFIGEGLQRGVKYLPMIQAEFREQRLPLDLAYIPLVESAFKNTARSRVRALGMWQFMSYTGREHGLTQNWYVDERSDPEKATKAAAQYLKTLGRMFDGDWHLAMASYNGGPGRVQRAMKRSRKTDFWSLTATSRYLPRETREYVPMILAAIVIAKNPSQYGFDLESQVPLAYEKVQVNDPVDLRLVAEWTNAPIDDIEALNPELRRWTTPVPSPSYDIKVPVGTGDAFRARLAEATPESLNAFQWHSVKRGETLLSISRKLKVRQADLAEANSLTLRSRVKVGQQLIIPRAPTTLLAARTVTPEPEAVLAELRPTASQKPVADSTPTEKADPERIVHRVKRGDTLSSIARLYNTSIASLKSWNTRTIRGNRINIGDRLTVFAARTAN